MAEWHAIEGFPGGSDGKVSACNARDPGPIPGLGRSHGEGNGIQLFVTPWIVACQTPLSMWFSRQEYWSGLPFPSPGKWSGDRQFIGNRIQSDDSKDDSRSQKKNGGKDRKYKKYLTKTEKN